MERELVLYILSLKRGFVQSGEDKLHFKPITF